ncbi:MAG: hypothetical protein HN919_00165 [Verrucomicrobia bacterium]|jgi:hypothetical protein|nr:hypothetical protein [Verrucomicrobiota bacterium]MBT7064691.1 hypothetical protein [Verrucomicrobiota bacterium]MBT7700187.1 hypothetical protein [Verrucomicrobiota bacterium]
MTAWWDGLTTINRGFFCAAAFFSVFFLWQLIAAMIGLDDDSGDDVGDGAGADEFDADADGTVVAFRLLSIRAIVTFCTLFTWGSALYLSRGEALGRAMGISTIWGLAGMASVAVLLSLLPKLAHTGTKRIASTLGAHGTVYLDIPEAGQGEVRIAVSDVISFVKARTHSGVAITSGTPVVVTRILGPATVEVEVVSETEEGGKK